MSFSWYSIDVYLPDKPAPIFTGVLSVNSENLINDFYETINGKTDFNENILVTHGTPSGLIYENFIVYVKNEIQYDNAYKKSWKQFDNFGAFIKKMSYYPNYEFLDLCCNNLGDENITNKGVIVTDDNNIFINAIFKINSIENPKPNKTSWYNISISSQPSSESIFNGYFSVDNNSNSVKGFYETINGTTNFNENLIVTNGLPSALKYDGYTIYVKNNIQYDNVYENNWKQFDYFGVLISKMSYYPNYKTLNLCSNNLGNQLIINNGDIVTGNNDIFLSVVFNIAPTIDPTCFNKGTKILCLNKNLEEEYIPIENLVKGDLVKSYKHGYRKIDLICKNTLVNNPSKFNECMYKMEKTEENDLLEDLIVTGGHAILVDELGDYSDENNKFFGETPKIDGKYLLLSCVSKDFKKLEDTKLYTYYHLTLENNDDDEERFGIWANGILTETPSKKLFTTSQCPK
jgi:hypothetical protein